jgi:hypothetical protein
MPKAPVVGDKYLVTYEELGRPMQRQDIEIPGLGWLVVDEADVHYGINNPDGAYFIRQSKSMNNRFVVVSRVQKA